jgi:hypothetical protein
MKNTIRIFLPEQGKILINPETSPCSIFWPGWNSCVATVKFGQMQGSLDGAEDWLDKPMKCAVLKCQEHPLQNS